MLILEIINNQIRICVKQWFMLIWTLFCKAMSIDISIYRRVSDTVLHYKGWWLNEDKCIKYSI